MSTPTSSRWTAAAELGRRAITTDDLAALLRLVVEVAADGLAAPSSSLLELLPDGRALFRAGIGLNAKLIGQAAIEMSAASAAGYVIRTQTALGIDDLRKQQRFIVSPLMAEHGIVSSLLAPICGTSRPLGVLAVHSPQPRAFTADDVAWLQILANIISPRLQQDWRPEDQNNQRLLRAEQMMAIGQVAAGVAHELRNPLTSIKGLIQINLRELEARGMPADDLAVVEHEIRRMEKTLQTFLDFARPPEPHRQLADLATVVEPVLALAGGRARKQQVELQFSRPPERIQASVDQDQLQQLMLNLVLNALDAMPQGGVVEVDLRPPQGGFVEIYVRDTGPGIAAHILPKVFETFVSSKETGVGLGLPLSRRIAEDHGGTLTAYNLPQRGACFLLRLPAPE